jgi:hypothetical protein
MADASRLDLSQFGAVPQPAGSVDVRGVIDELRAQAARTVERRDRVRDLVGRAESDDGNVAATYTAADGVQQLVLNPRAMRLAAEDLAAEIVRVTGRARHDLDRQRAEVAAESGPAPAPPDLEQSEARLAELRAALSGGAADVQAVVDRWRSQTSR